MKTLLKTKMQTTLFALLLISAIILALPNTTTQANETETTQNPQLTLPVSNQEISFTPKMTKPTWADKNDNNVEDIFEQEINQKQASGITEQDLANVTVTLKTQPTANDILTFVSHGGQLTTSAWKDALYGFGGTIPYRQILNFAQSNPNVLLIEKEQIGKAQITYAAQQIGARPYVWNTLGLQGDPNSSIAIVDTGIDSTHSDFAPGYGDQDFSEKIVGWIDPLTGSTVPFDDNGHGSHVSGLAAGNGFFSTNGSGTALASWGANLGSVSTPGGYLISGIMINQTGTIRINVKWKNNGSAKLSALRLYDGKKSLTTADWVQVASVSTTLEDRWYTLTYNLPSAPIGGYDMYHVVMSLASGSGQLNTMFQISWPSTQPADGFPAWTGIAPQTKLVGAKALDSSGSGNSLDLVEALNWIVANRQVYHIVVTSMSLGFTGEVTSIDNAVANLVRSGITTVVSAGNSGVGGNYIYTPGSVDEVITVAATNQFDDTADYSSQGGTSRYTGKTVKPDIAAPGGSFFAIPLLSVDSNYNEAEGAWSEVYVNDSAPMQGTSMSAPVVAGAASIVAQALGGFANWQWTRSQALMPKMILLMTATETYPNLREFDTSYSPTLERGGKDVHEGYGRLNLDAAADAVLNSYSIGNVITETLGRPPSITDISVLGQKLAWARKVQLSNQARYNFTLTVPSGADFDLYLYNSTGNYYGEPSIVAKSVNATTGGREQIMLTPPYGGTYYLVVKRATATTGGGTFVLESTFKPYHNVAVQAVELPATSIYVGNGLNMTVTVRNNGLNSESFNVTAFYNNTLIERRNVTNLASGSTLSLNFTWDTTGVTPSKYILKAQASLSPGEYNTTDNVCTYDGLIYVKVPGDVNSDGSVDNMDLAAMVQAYGAVPASYNWNPECDINKDAIVNIVDLKLLGENYSKTY